MFIDLSASVSVSPQISPEDVQSAKAAGYMLIINNRPDGEAPDQPSAAAIAEAADAADIPCKHIPMSNGGLTPDTIAAVREALAAAEGRTLMFCRSGTRSTMLWGLAEAQAGKDPAMLAAAARSAGYDLSPIYGVMQNLAASA